MEEMSPYGPDLSPLRKVQDRTKYRLFILYIITEKQFNNFDTL